MATAQSIMTGSTDPLKNEIDKIVNPVAQTYEQAQQYKSMLTIFYNEPVVYELLYDFGKRYYEATHKAELTKIGAGAVSDVILTILLAIFTAGTGAAANLAAKAPRLVKLFKLLEKITKTLKRLSPRHRLPKKRAGGPLSRLTKKKPDVDQKAKKDYPDKDKGGGPKKVAKPPISYDDLAKQSTKNPNSDKVILGKFLQDNKSYTKVAAHYEGTYLKIKDWRKLSKTLTQRDFWKINEMFLRQQIKQGKQIVFSHNPMKATGFFAKEVKFLKSLGYKFEQDGWVWKAVR